MTRLYIIGGVIAAILLGFCVALLRAFGAGKAAERAANIVEALNRGLEANKARASVDRSKKAEDDDPYNRDFNGR